MRQQCDGKILLSPCCHAYKLFVCQAIKCIRDNMTTKKIFFLVERCMILFLRFQCDAAGVGVLTVHISTGSPSLRSDITRG